MLNKNKIFISTLALIAMIELSGFTRNSDRNVTSQIRQFTGDSVRTTDNVRNTRYCEIFVVTGGVFGLTATVYNTLNCNDCPGDVWRSIDTEKLKEEFSARAIIMNGPRYFIMDEIGQTGKVPEKVMLGGLEMLERATFSVSKSDRDNRQPYEEHTIKRSTEFVYRKGNKVYELISPNGTYVMQSYSQIVDSSLTEADLGNLGARLKLPEGWEYQVRIPDEDLILKTFKSGEAHIIQDDLENTYQRVISN